MHPVGVAVTADGSRIYVGETGGDRIARVFDASGNELAVMAAPNPDVDHVPVYLAVDPLAGEVYVTDRPAGAIHVYDANGTYARTFDPGEDDSRAGSRWPSRSTRPATCT